MGLLELVRLDQQEEQEMLDKGLFNNPYQDMGQGGAHQAGPSSRPAARARPAVELDYGDL